MTETLYAAAAGGIMSLIGHLVHRAVNTTDKTVEELRGQVLELRAMHSATEKEIAIIKMQAAVEAERNKAMGQKLDEVLDGTKALRKSLDRLTLELAKHVNLEESNDGR
jgi:ACT domain-containing protein